MLTLHPDRLPSPYRPEGAVVHDRLSRLTGRLDWAAAAREARPWVQAVRDNPPPFWAMESLLKEYPISSAEGLALMRLAEALLRVPDVQTATALTADQLGQADFDSGSTGWMGTLSAAALAWSKKCLPREAHAGMLGRLGARAVVAATVRAVQLLGRQFVLGQTLPEAIGRTERPLRYSYDMLGEGACTQADALRHLASYHDAIETIAKYSIHARPTEDNDGISIKLSALHPRYEHTQRERVMAELVPRVWGLCERAVQANIPLTLDAEEVDRLELSLDVFEALLDRVARHCPGWVGFGLALQAYQTRALELIDTVVRMARQRHLRLMCRLVKGAYWDTEIKRAQAEGLPHYPVFTHKHHTDVSYLACAQALLAAPDALYPQFATHNAATIAAIVQMARANHDGLLLHHRFELQRLHGMGDGVYREVLQNPELRCRVYAPVGPHRDLLAYLVRRLLENGANSSFVHQLADASVGLDTLLASPLHPSEPASLPLPAALLGASHANSAGLDLAEHASRVALADALARCRLPEVAMSDANGIAILMQRSMVCYHKWSATPVAQRADSLRAAAELMQQRLPDFCALIVREAHKTWGDAVGEVREAIDFLRYYAGQAERLMQPQPLPVHGQGPAAFGYGLTGERNVLSLRPRGVWVCISPWNFPLAIFLGQVSAALATGNTVLAKPAEQTPAVAWAALKLLHEAGVPEDAVQLLHGPGETVGAALVAHPNVAGVAFTGSTQVARLINRSLAAKAGPIVPLIAETGGLNAMVVDSTALPEQVVDAVVQSAFRSAGQRCSALRLLCVHEAVADGVLDMLKGAAEALVVGHPADLATDVGPVIDAEAHRRITRHIERLRREATPVLSPARIARPDVPNLIAPHVFELRRIDELQHEIFGPVLHVVRWGGAQLRDATDVIEQVNALGYGLTLGIQTRIDSRADELAQQATVGNVYVNRNTIGAVVGVQPFGGSGLSGTGPKAGGPHYLLRFCNEQTVTVNTAAAGGNAFLLSHG